MSVYPLPLAVVPSSWQDDGTHLFSIANRDVAILATRKLLLDGPLGNDYLTCPSDGVISTYLAGVLKFQLDGVNGLVMADGKFLSSVADGAAAVGFSLNAPSYTTAGSKLLSLQNNSVEKVSISKEGFYHLGDNWSVGITSGDVATSSILIYTPAAGAAFGQLHNIYCWAGSGSGYIIGNQINLSAAAGANFAGCTSFNSVINTAAGAALSANIYGGNIDLEHRGSVGGFNGYQSYAQLYAGSSAAYVTGFQNYITANAGSTVSGNVRGFNNRITISAGATIGASPMANFSVLAVDSGTVTGYSVALYGEVDLVGTATAEYTHAGSAGVYVTSGSKSTAEIVGFRGWMWDDQTTNPDKPTGMVCGVEGWYATPGISLSSTFTLGGTAARCAMLGFSHDSVNSNPHAVFLAFTTDGSGDGTAVPAAFKAVDCRTIAGKGYNYGLDLIKEAGLNNGIKTADIRGHAGNTIKNLTAGVWEADTDIVLAGAACVPQTAGETITAGQVVYSSGNDTVSKAIADASIADAEKAWGAVVTGNTVGLPINVAHSGTVRELDMDAGLSPAVGKLAYLSNVTAGSSMDNPPATPTHYIVELGRIISVAGYPGTGKVKVIWQPKEPILIP